MTANGGTPTIVVYTEANMSSEADDYRCPACGVLVPPMTGVCVGPHSPREQQRARADYDEYQRHDTERRSDQRRRFIRAAARRAARRNET